MALTAAERQRRSRAHRADDHSWCDPEKCDGHTVTASPASSDVDDLELGSRGRRLWRELNAEKVLTPKERVLAEEASRLADRLERLDRILRGDEAEWLRVYLNDVDDEIVLRVDRVLGEARQYAIALKVLLGELRMMRTALVATSVPPAAVSSPAPATSQASPKGSLLDLAAAIERKRAALTSPPA